MLSFKGNFSFFILGTMSVFILYKYSLCKCLQVARMYSYIYVYIYIYIYIYISFSMSSEILDVKWLYTELRALSSIPLMWLLTILLWFIQTKGQYPNWEIKQAFIKNLIKLFSEIVHHVYKKPPSFAKYANSLPIREI